MKKVNWKSVLGWTIAALVIIGIIGTNMYQQHENNTDGKKVVYAMLPLTGAVAEVGKEAQRYTQIWQKMNPDAPFKVEFVDTESKPDRAVTALNQVLFKTENPIVISLFSFISKATIPVIEKTNGFIFAPGTVMSMGENITHYQRVSSSISDSLTPIVNYVKPNQKVGIINLDDEYGALNSNYFKDEILKKGATLTIHETLGLRDLDVRIPVYKVLESKPDIIYVTGSSSMAYANILKELAAHEYKGIVLVDYAFQNRNNIKNIGNINLTIFVSITPTKQFIANYPKEVEELKKNGLEVYYMPFQMFDTLNLIKYTMENNLSLNQETYTKMGKWKGVAGDVIFPGNGDSLYPFVLVQYKNGEFIPIEK